MFNNTILANASSKKVIGASSVQASTSFKTWHPMHLNLAVDRCGGGGASLHPPAHPQFSPTAVGEVCGLLVQPQTQGFGWNHIQCKSMH